MGLPASAFGGGRRAFCWKGPPHPSLARVLICVRFLGRRAPLGHSLPPRLFSLLLSREYPPSTSLLIRAPSPWSGGRMCAAPFGMHLWGVRALLLAQTRLLKIWLSPFLPLRILFLLTTGSFRFGSVVNGCYFQASF